MNLLAKFEQVNVSHVDKITEYDKRACQKIQDEYDQFIRFAEQYVYFLKKNSLTNSFYHTSELESEFKKQIKERVSKFVSKIINHFTNEYKVTIDGYKIRDKLTHYQVRYEEVVDKIMDQLDGYTFLEKAKKEIKDAFKSQVSRRKEVQVHKNKLTLQNLFWYRESYRKGYYSLGYSTDHGIYALLKALRLFDCGDIELCFTFSRLLQYLRGDLTGEEFFKKYPFHHLKKVEGIRPYKNHKIDVYFKTHQDCLDFAREFCGLED